MENNKLHRTIDNKKKLAKFLDLGHCLEIQEYSERFSEPEIVVHKISSVSPGEYTEWCSFTLTGGGGGGLVVSIDKIYDIVEKLLIDTDYDVENVWMCVTEDKRLVNVLELDDHNATTTVKEFVYVLIEPNPHAYTAFVSGIDNDLLQELNAKMQIEKELYLQDYAEKLKTCKHVVENHCPQMKKVMPKLMAFYDIQSTERKTVLNKLFLNFPDIKENVHIDDYSKITHQEFDNLVRMYWDAFELGEFLESIKTNLTK